MSLIGGIGAARRHLFTWFGGLALSAKAGIATAAFVTMSAGVVIGAPYTPTSAPWFTPQVAPYATQQTPAPLKPSMVEAATPTTSPTPGSARSTTQRTSQQTATSGATTQLPTGATTETSAPSASRAATTMASASSSAKKTTATATAGVQASASVSYKNCAQASRSGAAPITSGQPGYRPGLDPNHNGVACE
jgi:hypothetical protein